MKKLVLVRHGESVWNRENRFTGWTDVDLSSKGVEEAHEAGRLLKKEGYVFDRVFTSLLKRAIKTSFLALEEMEQLWLPVERSWRLNERHYGSLQGLSKPEMTEKFGEPQVKIWRRSYSTPPPPLEKTDERNPARDPRYSNVPAGEMPLTEALADTVKRFIPFWEKTLRPAVQKERVIVFAHGNSIRALLKHIQNISEEEIVEINIPTAIPLVLEFDDSISKVTRQHYLGDPEKVKAAIAGVKGQAQGKKN